MSSFRKQQKIYRKLPGDYIGGKWTEGAEDPTPIIIKASVQPAAAGDYDMMQATSGGRRLEGMVRIYSDTELIAAGEGKTNGDVLAWRGNRYLVIGVAPWQSGVIPHFRMFAVKELEP